MVKFIAANIISVLVCTGNLFAETYYVASTGNDANAGTLALPWKTITHASAIAEPGDTVYVQAGNYSENVVFSKSGTSASPIVFQGYKATPGDAPPQLVNNPNPYAGFNAIDMPTFDGGDRANGTGFNCQNRAYLIISNFQIHNYAYGFIGGGTSASAGNLQLFNINVMYAGNASADYSGEGILLGSMGTRFSNNNTITNCLVVNSAAEGIGINGDSNTITGCKVYCNENTANAATDYYVIVTGNYNTFRNCYIERLAGLTHKGHGYTAKTNAEQVVDKGLALPAIASQYNKFYFCTAKNMGESFCVRHRTAQFNLFYHCKAIGTHTGAANSPSGEGNCIVIRDGASDNIFDGCVAESCSSGILFSDTVEDGDTGVNPTGHPGNNNILINCIIYNSYLGVSYSGEGIPSDAGNNTIANCTFYKTRYLHYAARSCKNIKYIGNIYYGCLPLQPGGYFRGNAFASDIVPNGANTYFLQCNFYNIEGGMPVNFVASSSGSISADPDFKDLDIPDLHLQPGSPCIDAMDALAYNTHDYDSIPRPQAGRFDMGAFEYPLITAVSTVTSPEMAVTVFPNPATYILTIITDNTDHLISLHDVAGREVYSVRSASIKTEIPVKGILNGVYFLKVKSKTSVTTKEIIIRK